jgi:hypothetical protein
VAHLSSTRGEARLVSRDMVSSGKSNTALRYTKA